MDQSQSCKCSKNALYNYIFACIICAAHSCYFWSIKHVHNDGSYLYFFDKKIRQLIGFVKQILLFYHVFLGDITTVRYNQSNLLICISSQTPQSPTLREKAILLCRMMPNYEKRFPEDFELHAQYLELINYVYR